eukprot:scaffold4955_cov204-Amphora_coffeaeformis.AAC.8
MTAYSVIFGKTNSFVGSVRRGAPLLAVSSVSVLSSASSMSPFNRTEQHFTMPLSTDTKLEAFKKVAAPAEYPEITHGFSLPVEEVITRLANKYAVVVESATSTPPAVPAVSSDAGMPPKMAIEESLSVESLQEVSVVENAVEKTEIPPVELLQEVSVGETDDSAVCTTLSVWKPSPVAKVQDDYNFRLVWLINEICKIFQEAKNWNDFEDKEFVVVDPCALVDDSKVSLHDDVPVASLPTSIPAISSSVCTTASNFSTANVVTNHPKQPANVEYKEMALLLESIGALNHVKNLGASPFRTVEYWSTEPVKPHPVAVYKIPSHMRRNNGARPYETRIVRKAQWFRVQVLERKVIVDHDISNNVQLFLDSSAKKRRFLSIYQCTTTYDFNPMEDGTVKLVKQDYVAGRMMNYQDFKKWVKFYGSKRFRPSNLNYREYYIPCRKQRDLDIAKMAIEGGFKQDQSKYFLAAFGGTFRFQPCNFDQSIWTVMHLKYPAKMLVQLGRRCPRLKLQLEEWMINNPLMELTIDQDVSGMRHAMIKAGYVGEGIIPKETRQAIKDQEWTLKMSIYRKIKFGHDIDGLLPEETRLAIKNKEWEAKKPNIPDAPAVPETPAPPGTRAALAYFQERRRQWEASKARRRPIQELPAPTLIARSENCTRRLGRRVAEPTIESVVVNRDLALSPPESDSETSTTPVPVDHVSPPLHRGFGFTRPGNQTSPVQSAPHRGFGFTRPGNQTSPVQSAPHRGFGSTRPGNQTPSVQPSLFTLDTSFDDDVPAPRSCSRLY